MKTDEIRKKYLEFFKARGHTEIPRANIVPKDDPTTLFTGSGMQPLIPYLLGMPHPGGVRVVDSQTSFRAEDIEEVGDNRHTTFFEMLGNWSFGDYFKREQLGWFFEFLTAEVGLDPRKLYVTCYIGDARAGVSKDTEAAAIWQELFKGVGIDAETAAIGSEENGYRKGMSGEQRIFFYGDKNWWSRVGAPSKMPVGEPGGPDSEVFYLFDGVQHDTSFGAACHPNCDCGRFLEIGNSVFMQYVKTESGGFDELPQKNVDFGGGLERIAAAALDSPDVFKISLLWPIVEAIAEHSGKEYTKNPEPFRVIADHLRAAVWLGVDGVTPSNTQQGYVMRRLIRRAVRFALELGMETDVMPRLAPIVFDLYKADFPEVADRGEAVIEMLKKEETTFRQTLRKGVKELQKMAASGKLDGNHLFILYDTYGFPVELSLEEAKRAEIAVVENWRAEFDQKMTGQKERSRTATQGQFKGGLGGHTDIHKKYHTATHLMYAALRQVLGEHVIQRGSNITEERLRFDFSHGEKMTDEQKQAVEDLVNEQIEQDLKVSWQEYPTEEAMQLGARGQFGDKYGETVKVYKMQKEGEEPFSFEICGGPHVDHTAQLGEGGLKFKIQKEESSSAGVRRIKAVLQ